MLLRDYEEGDKEKVANLILELKKYYPKIENWIPREINRIEKGEDSCRIVDAYGRIGGVAIFGKKNEFCAKLKTFYLNEEFRGSAIGENLLKYVIDKCAEARIKRIYVTFAEEEVNNLLPFFEKYGFLFDGVSPFRYREGASEYIMSKTLTYGEIDEEEFADFVLEYLFKLRGYKILQRGKDFAIVQKVVAVKESYKIYVKIIIDTDAEKWIFEEVKKEGDKLGCFSKIIVSYYPLPPSGREEDLKLIDGFDIETMFYPIVLKRDKYAGVISSVEKKYADRILYEDSRALLDADKKALRTENVFFKYPTTYKKIKRGSTFLFYVSGGVKGIIGEGKIKDIVIDMPENLYENYGGKGVYHLKDIQACKDRNNRTLAIVLGRTIRYKKKIPLEEIKRTKPNYDPQGSSFISQEELDKFRELGGVRIK